MGNLIYSQDFITVADAAITSRSDTAGYAKADIMDYWHLKARHRAADVTKSDSNPLFRIDLGAAETVVAVYLSDVNYNKVRIRAHASDLTTNWAASTYDSGDISLSQNAWTGRYQGYVPTVFNLRYMAICTPAAATAVGSYTTYWETGCVAIFDSVTTFSENIAYPLQQETQQLFVDVGRTGRVNLSGTVGWVGGINFGNRTITNEAEAKTFGRLDKSQPVLIYLNQSDTSEAYLCVVDQNYSSEWFALNLAKNISTIRVRELIGA